MNSERILKLISAAATIIPLLFLVFLLATTFIDGLPRLDWQFLTSYPSRNPEIAGFLAAIGGTLWVMVLTACIAIPLGIGAALYLEEYAPKNRLTEAIEINIANLSGVPSIIYGLLGLELFVRFMDLGRSVLAGALTLSLLALPLIIVAAREAIKTVPNSLREGSDALGAYRFDTVRKVVLPMSLPGMLTGVILSLSRAIGETAPLITLGALTYVAFLPDSLSSPFTAMPIQIFNWVSRPQEGFHTAAAAGIVVLLAMMLVLNAAAIIIRARMRRKLDQ